MSVETVDRNRHTKAFHAVTLEADLADPALVPAAFDLLRHHAKAHGLSDVGQIYIHLTVEFQGQTVLVEVDELATRLENLWLGQITKHEVTLLREVGEPKQVIRYK